MQDMEIGIYFLIIVGLGITPWFDLLPLCLGGSVYFVLSGIYKYLKTRKENKGIR